VYRLTGRPISELQRTAGPVASLRISTVALLPTTRAELGERIEQRFDAMVTAGLVAEVERLRARGDLTPDLPALRAVGYRQIWGHLEGRYGWAEARTKAIVATRQYAKRQLTWLRGDPRCEPWPAFDPGLTERMLRLAEETRLDSS
jgi:tRNA dimethylallyltransferase